MDDLLALSGAGIAVGDATREPEAGTGLIQVGVDREGVLPAGPSERFDILVTTRPAPPRPWVFAEPAKLEESLDHLRAYVAAQPASSAVLAQVLRMTLRLDFDQALALESMAYSMLLASSGFRAWRAGRPKRRREEEGAERVNLVKADGVLRIELSRPAARNAFDAAMRDALVEALEFALEDPDALPVELVGAGPGFSSGGDLDEFGDAPDPAEAHLVRTLQSPARLVAALGPRLTARLHGACIGAGIEVPAAAARITARPGATFRLPEVSMGLIPGAGGTATVPRRIGRERACYMALSGAEIDLDTALAWGLVDVAEPNP